MFIPNLKTDKHTVVIKAGDIYTASAIPPHGYIAKEFRSPRDGETYLTCDGDVACASADFSDDTPRYILEKKKTVVFRSTGIIRCVKYGEYYYNPIDKSISMWRVTCNSVEAFEIYTRSEE